MRIVCHCLLVYLLIIVMSVVWSHAPQWLAPPQCLALSALYLGLVGRRETLFSLIATIVLGYVADLVLGYPKGVMAFSMGIICVFGSMLQGQMMVRGRLLMALLSAAAAFVALSIVHAILLFRGSLGMGFNELLLYTLLSCLMTGLVGPFLIAAFRRIDAAFARTQRDRLAALEGLLS